MLLQNEKNQQQKQQQLIPNVIKNKVSDSENGCPWNNLRIYWIIEEENESQAQSEKKLQEINKDQLKFEQDIEIKLSLSNGKTKIDRAPNKNRAFVAKILNFQDKQEVLFEHKTHKLSTKCIFINKGFSGDIMQKRKDFF